MNDWISLPKIAIGDLGLHFTERKLGHDNTKDRSGLFAILEKKLSSITFFFDLHCVDVWPGDIEFFSKFASDDSFEYTKWMFLSVFTSFSAS